MTEAKEYLTVALGREIGEHGGDYIVERTEFTGANGESKKETPKQNLHVGHPENVLNHFGKNGWILEKNKSG